jgi:DNA-binding IclR family transcriptional regulator
MKALSLLECVSGAGKPIALAELAVRLGLPKPTAHRIALLLEREGYLEREQGSRRFVVGSRLVDLSLDALLASARHGPRHVLLKALSAELGETGSLWCLVGAESVCLDRIEMESMLGVQVTTGTRLPLHCTATGKLFLSIMPRRRREHLINSLPLDRRTESTITDPEALVAEVDRVRDEGVATEDEELHAGVVSVAVPVSGPRERLWAGLAVTVPKARHTIEEAMSFVPVMRRMARRLSATFVTDEPDDDAHVELPLTTT